MCSRPRKPQRKPKPRAADVSGSRENEASLRRSLSSASRRSVVAGRIGREDPGEHHRLGRLEAGQRRRARVAGLGDRVADARIGDLLDGGGEEADLARAELGPLARERREHADRLDLVLAARRHEAHLLLRAQHAVDDAHQDHDAAVGVVPAVEQQHAQRRLGIAHGRRQLRDDRLEDLVDPLPFLGRRQDRLRGVDADHLLDLAPHVLGIGGRQIDLVDDRDDREVVVRPPGRRWPASAPRRPGRRRRPAPRPRRRPATATPRSESRRARACR